MLGLIAFITHKVGSIFNSENGPGALIPNDGSGKVEPEREISGATLSDSVAYAISEDLFQAMQQVFGVDYPKLKQAFSRLKTMGDYNKVFELFGAQHYNKFSGATLASSHIFDPPLNLTEWLKHELNQEQQNDLKKLNSQLEVF